MIPLEIERKFLIRQTEEMHGHITRRTEIVQTYLLRDDPDIQRRVRSMCTDGETEYFYTEKKFVSPTVREENEKSITEEEYNLLLGEADNDLRPVIKTRSILVYENQCFEIDSYPFDNDLAVMELELEREEQTIKLPPFVNVIREVTGEKSYSNASLALNGCFPNS